MATKKWQTTPTNRQSAKSKGWNTYNSGIAPELPAYLRSDEPDRTSLKAKQMERIESAAEQRAAAQSLKSKSVPISGSGGTSQYAADYAGLKAFEASVPDPKGFFSKESAEYIAGNLANTTAGIARGLYTAKDSALKAITSGLLMATGQGDTDVSGLTMKRVKDIYKGLARSGLDQLTDGISERAISDIRSTINSNVKINGKGLLDTISGIKKDVIDQYAPTANEEGFANALRTKAQDYIQGNYVDNNRDNMGSASRLAGDVVGSMPYTYLSKGMGKFSGPMFVAGLGMQVNEQLDQGGPVTANDFIRIYSKAAISSAISTKIESFFDVFDKPMKLATQAINSQAKKFIGREILRPGYKAFPRVVDVIWPLIKAAGGEGAEEMLEYPLQLAVDYSFDNPDGTITDFLKDSKFNYKDFGYNGMVGAIAGALFGLSSTAMSKIQSDRRARTALGKDLPIQLDQRQYLDTVSREIFNTPLNKITYDQADRVIYLAKEMLVDPMQMGREVVAKYNAISQGETYTPKPRSFYGDTSAAASLPAARPMGMGVIEYQTMIADALKAPAQPIAAAVTTPAPAAPTATPSARVNNVVRGKKMASKTLQNIVASPEPVAITETQSADAIDEFKKMSGATSKQNATVILNNFVAWSKANNVAPDAPIADTYASFIRAEGDNAFAGTNMVGGFAAKRIVKRSAMPVVAQETALEAVTEASAEIVVEPDGSIFKAPEIVPEAVAEEALEVVAKTPNDVATQANHFPGFPGKLTKAQHARLMKMFKDPANPRRQLFHIGGKRGSFTEVPGHTVIIPGAEWLDVFTTGAKEDGTIRLYDVATGKFVYQYNRKDSLEKIAERLNKYRDGITENIKLKEVTKQFGTFKPPYSDDLLKQARANEIYIEHLHMSPRFHAAVAVSWPVAPASKAVQPETINKDHFWDPSEAKREEPIRFNPSELMAQTPEDKAIKPSKGFRPLSERVTNPDTRERVMSHIAAIRAANGLVSNEGYAQLYLVTSNANAGRMIDEKKFIMTEGSYIFTTTLTGSVRDLKTGYRNGMSGIQMNVPLEMLYQEFFTDDSEATFRLHVGKGRDMELTNNWTGTPESKIFPRAADLELIANKGYINREIMDINDNLSEIQVKVIDQMAESMYNDAVELVHWNVSYMKQSELDAMQDKADDQANQIAIDFLTHDDEWVKNHYALQTNEKLRKYFRRITRHEWDTKTGKSLPRFNRNYRKDATAVGETALSTTMATSAAAAVRGKRGKVKPVWMPIVNGIERINSKLNKKKHFFEILDGDRFKKINGYREDVVSWLDTFVAMNRADYPFLYESTTGIPLAPLAPNVDAITLAESLEARKEQLLVEIDTAQLTKPSPVLMAYRKVIRDADKVKDDDAKYKAKENKTKFVAENDKRKYGPRASQSQTPASIPAETTVPTREVVDITPAVQVRRIPKAIAATSTPAVEAPTTVSDANVPASETNVVAAPAVRKANKAAIPVTPEARARQIQNLLAIYSKRLTLTPFEKDKVRELTNELADITIASVTAPETRVAPAENKEHRIFNMMGAQGILFPVAVNPTDAELDWLEDRQDDDSYAGIQISAMDLPNGGRDEVGDNYEEAVRLRRVVDDAGNVYAWSIGDALHDDIVKYLERNKGAEFTNYKASLIPPAPVAQDQVQPAEEIPVIAQPAEEKPAETATQAPTKSKGKRSKAVAVSTPVATSATPAEPVATPDVAPAITPAIEAAPTPAVAEVLAKEPEAPPIVARKRNKKAAPASEVKTVEQIVPVKAEPEGIAPTPPVLSDAASKGKRSLQARGQDLIELTRQDKTTAADKIAAALEADPELLSAMMAKVNTIEKVQTAQAKGVQTMLALADPDMEYTSIDGTILPTYDEAGVVTEGFALEYIKSKMNGNKGKNQYHRFLLNFVDALGSSRSDEKMKRLLDGLKIEDIFYEVATDVEALRKAKDKYGYGNESTKERVKGAAWKNRRALYDKYTKTPGMILTKDDFLGLAMYAEELADTDDPNSILRADSIIRMLADTMTEAGQMIQGAKQVYDLLYPMRRAQRLIAEADKGMTPDQQGKIDTLANDTMTKLGALRKGAATDAVKDVQDRVDKYKKPGKPRKTSEVLRDMIIDDYKRIMSAGGNVELEERMTRMAINQMFKVYRQNIDPKLYQRIPGDTVWEGLEYILLNRGDMQREFIEARDQVAKEFREKYPNDTALNSFFDSLNNDLLSDNFKDAIIAETFKDSGVKLMDMAQKYFFNGGESIKQFIAMVDEKLDGKLSENPLEKKVFQDLITDRFSVRMEERKEQARRTIRKIDAQAPARKLARKKTDPTERTIELLSKATFQDSLMLDNVNRIWAERLGVRMLNSDMVADIYATMKLIQKEPDDEIKNQMYEDMVYRVGQTLEGTAYEKFLAWRRASMLFNPLSWIKNGVSNLATMPYYYMMDRVETALYRMGEPFFGAVNPADRIAPLSGWVSAKKAPPHIKDLVEKHANRGKIKIFVARTAKYSISRMLNAEKRIFGSSKLEKILKIPLHMMSEGHPFERSRDEDKAAADKWYTKTFGWLGDSYMFSRHFQAAFRNKLLTLGVTDAMTKDPAQKVHLDALVTEALADAFDVATIRTYRKMNAVSKKLQGIKTGMTTAADRVDAENHPTRAALAKIGATTFNIAFDIAAPFINTPVALIYESYKFSPANIVSGLIKLGVFKGQMLLGKETKPDQLTNAYNSLAQGLVGTVGQAALGFLLGMLGFIDTFPPDEEKEKVAWAMEGRQAWSLHFGNKSYSVNWLQPIASSLMFGAELAKQYFDPDYGDDEDGDAWTQAFNAMTTGTLLTSIQRALSPNGSYEESGLTDIISNLIGSASSQSVATSFSRMAGIFDPYERDIYTGGLLENMYNKFLTNVPYLNTKNDVKVDVWGMKARKVEDRGALGAVGRAAFAFLLPFNPEHGYKDPVSMEVLRLYHDVESDPGRALPPVASADIKAFDIDNEEFGNYGPVNLTLSGEEHAEYMMWTGQLSKRFVEETMALPEYKSMADEDKIKAIAGAYTLAKKLATEKMVFPRLREYIKAGGR